ncbi:MAG: hypothetical protein SFX18_15785 [Pirellulales bacterium]|nr:hypothetical protein [Pirellulales bacterium]
MSHTYQPLESLRLAQYVEQIPCYICEEGNSFDAELCRYCFAPMALAHQVNVQQIRPQMLGVLGPSGVGKTVYMGMLMDMLSRRPQGVQLLTRGAFSLTLQQNTMAALARCEFPAKTPSEPDRWNWLHCQITMPKRSRPLEMILPDLAGDALYEEVNHPYTYRGLRSFLEKASAMALLVDAPELRKGSREQDYYSMKLLHYLDELDRDSKAAWHHRPLAVVLTKSDECDLDTATAGQFVQEHAAGLAQLLRERFRRHQFFAAGVAGACTTRYVKGQGYVQYPLRIEPRGIVEPFVWLMEQIPQGKR